MIALALFAVGLFFGIQLAKPPPLPDLGALRPPDEIVSPPPPPAEPDAAPAPLDILELRRQPPPGGDRLRVSIVIDDLGRSLRDIDRLADLRVPITYSVLPFESQTREVVAELQRRGAEILCHLPMEALGAANPGPGALLRSMSHEQLATATRLALAAVPGAIGVNNHMGSGIVSQRKAMATVLSVIAGQELFFLDSRTSADTVGYSLARHLGMPAAERQVFLDTDRDRAFIHRQFEELLAQATRRGGAIGIAHPYPETLDILAAQVPAAVARGFEFVAASELLDG